MSARGAIVIANDRQLGGSIVSCAVWMACGGILAGVSFFLIDFHPARVLLAIGLLMFLGGAYFALRRRSIRYQPLTRMVETVMAFLGRERVAYTPLGSLERVSLEARRSPWAPIYHLALRGANANVALAEPFYGRAEAVAAAVRAASVTGLPLDERNERGIVTRLDAVALISLAEEHAKAVTPPPWWRDPSVLALLIANLLPLVGVLFWGWRVGPLLLLFWTETLIIGAYTLLRMWLAGILGMALSGVFIVSYGGLVLIYGTILNAWFGKPTPPWRRGDSFDVVVDAVRDGASLVHDVLYRYGLAWAVLALAVSHGIYFLTSFLVPQSYKTANALDVMAEPYKRFFAIHLVIIIGGIGAAMLVQPAFALAVLVVLKIAFDLGAHLSRDRARLLRDYRALAQVAR